MSLQHPATDMEAFIVCQVAAKISALEESESKGNATRKLLRRSLICETNPKFGCDSVVSTAKLFVTLLDCHTK